MIDEKEFERLRALGVEFVNSVLAREHNRPPITGADLYEAMISAMAVMILESRKRKCEVCEEPSGEKVHCSLKCYELASGKRG